MLFSHVRLRARLAPTRPKHPHGILLQPAAAVYASRAAASVEGALRRDDRGVGVGVRRQEPLYGLLVVRVLTCMRCLGTARGKLASAYSVGLRRLPTTAYADGLRRRPMPTAYADGLRRPTPTACADGLCRRP